MAAQLSMRPPADDGLMSQLPTITCSSCGQQISLEGMAEHICAPMPPAPARSPPRANNYPNPVPRTRLAPPSHSSSVPRAPSPLRPANGQPAPRPSFEQPQIRPSFDNQRPQPPRSPFQPQRAPASKQQPQPQPQPTFNPVPVGPPPETKVGGAAGMAGVGRRGFAAVAAAAMFVQQPQPHALAKPASVLNVPHTSTPQMNPRSPSPYSSSHSHGSNHAPGPNHGHGGPPQPLAPPSGPTHRRPSAAEHPNAEAGSSKKFGNPSSATRARSPLDVNSPSSPPQLAYLDSSTVKSPTSTEDMLSPVVTKRIDTGHDRLSPVNKYFNADDDKAPNVRGGTSRDGHGVEFPKKQKGDAETASLYSTSSRGHTKSGASLERSLSSPFESTSSPALSTSTHPTSAGTSATDRLKVQNAHPTRSNTSPTLSRGDKPKDQPTTRRRSEKQCVKCGKKISDGKWILVDSSESEKPTVLCEYDWKMLYLPKCRRCDKPIEGQAVGSTDGQIKGKYHRDCFNCTSCQKPFPDKSFYVFDGKPFCEYHYHEANNSLCASPRCGMPIEGACAVAHNGDRYHPAHFVCEQSGCKEELHDEYWEIEGTRLCDRHARAHPMFEDATSQAGLSDEAADEVRDSLGTLSIYDAGHTSFGRAQKRMTRYVDL